MLVSHIAPQALKPVSCIPSFWIDAPAVTRTIAVWCGHLILGPSLFPALLYFQLFSISSSSLFPALLYSRLFSIPSFSLFQTAISWVYAKCCFPREHVEDVGSGYLITSTGAILPVYISPSHHRGWLIVVPIPCVLCPQVQFDFAYYSASHGYSAEVPSSYVGWCPLLFTLALENSVELSALASISRSIHCVFDRFLASKRLLEESTMAKYVQGTA